MIFDQMCGELTMVVAINGGASGGFGGFGDFDFVSKNIIRNLPIR